jgi:alkylation response protein AidB-like acyl-CoA dehydrogenase
MAEIEIDLMALEYTELRGLAREGEGKGLGPESSLLKIKGSEIQQRATELAMEAAGRYAAPHLTGADEVGANTLPIGPPYARGVADSYFNMRKTSIYGGSNEIQRNIIAKAVLGL